MPHLPCQGTLHSSEPGAKRNPSFHKLLLVGYLVAMTRKVTIAQGKKNNSLRKMMLQKIMAMLGKVHKPASMGLTASIGLT